MHFKYYFFFKILILILLFCNLIYSISEKYYFNDNNYLNAREKRSDDGVSDLLEKAQEFFSEDYSEDYDNYDYNTTNSEIPIYSDYTTEGNTTEEITSNTLPVVTSLSTTTVSISSTTEIPSTKIFSVTSTTTKIPSTKTVYIASTTTEYQSTNILTSTTATMAIQNITTLSTALTLNNISITTKSPLMTSSLNAEKGAPKENNIIVMPSRAYSIYNQVLLELQKYTPKPGPYTFKQVHNYPETILNNTLKFQQDLNKVTIV